VDFVAEVGKLN